MSESVAAAGGEAPAQAPAAAPAEAAKPAAPAETKAEAQTAEEILELMLEDGKPAVKVPVSKIPLDKLNPHLAKYRSETDKLRSEYDKNAKALQERSTALEKVLAAVKSDTRGALKELGVDPEAFAEQLLAERVRQAMREAEEQADPKKRTAREADEERERLRKENEELKKSQAERDRAQVKARVAGARDAVIAKLPEAYRDGAGPIVLAMFRQAVAEGKDITIDDAAKAVLEVQRSRARAAIERDEELRKLLGGQPAAPAPKGEPAKVLPHPASKAAPRNEQGKFQKKGEEGDTAGDILQKIQRGQF